ncbi:hypothetical protein O3G_MSEX000892 [Manduca sexta]|nr:hypothetical protein O3G_MSEX000892 [Manduca sexta]
MTATCVVSAAAPLPVAGRARELVVVVVGAAARGVGAGGARGAAPAAVARRPRRTLQRPPLQHRRQRPRVAALQRRYDCPVPRELRRAQLAAADTGTAERAVLGGAGAGPRAAPLRRLRTRRYQPPRLHHHA